MSRDRITRLDHAERWFHDGLRVVDPPGGLVSLEVDMSAATALRRRLAELGTPVTFTHLLVHAAASALTTNPELHRLVAGTKRLNPEQVDVCLSIAGDAAVTPVLMIRNAGAKSIAEISEEVQTGADIARLEDARRLEILRKWGWIIPLGVMRRALIRFLLGQLWYRRRASGTFQVTAVPNVDYCIPFLFNAVGALGAGRVQDRVIAVAGQPEVRPTQVLTLCFDHKVWNGMEAARFLNCVKLQLETLS